MHTLSMPDADEADQDKNFFENFTAQHLDQYRQFAEEFANQFSQQLLNPNPRTIAAAAAVHQAQGLVASRSPLLPSRSHPKSPPKSPLPKSPQSLPKSPPK